MTIAIVDDTTRDRELLKGMLAHYFSSYGTDTEIHEFRSGEEFLKAYRPKRYAVIFFDIYMGGITGMDAAARVYERDKDCRLVFFSSSADYAVDSYKVRAAYYLVKPIKYRELSMALDCFCRELLEEGRGLEVTVRGGTGVTVPFGDLLYVESLKRTVRVHIRDAVLEAAEPFMAVAGRLEQEERFLCCNRGIYVNMDWIQGIEDANIILKNGETLPVRVRGRSQVKKEYMEYALKDLRRQYEG